MAAGATYEAIQTTTLGSATTAVTFSSIPASWTDLRLVVVGSFSGGGGNAAIQFNGDSGSNYSITSLNGTGTAASSFGSVNTSYIQFTYYFGINTDIVMRTADIFSYAGSTYKTLFTDEINDLNGTGGGISKKIAMWRSTAAITSIYMYAQNPPSIWATGSTFTLYGIKAA